MAKTFITDDFLLQTKAARRLYHDYAEPTPIYDFHCHLSAKAIAEDYHFKNLAEAWLAGDHYKWRAMRINGVDEKYITGDAPDNEKFVQWAKTVPATLRNPLYHWTHLELLRYFGIDELLDGDSASEIYDACSEMLRTKDFGVRGLLKKMNVKLVCTTEGPTDTLDYHKKIKKENIGFKVNTAFRPDKAITTSLKQFHEKLFLPELNKFIDKLGEVVGKEINDFGSFMVALTQRHKEFHNEGCRLSDYGLESAYVNFGHVEVVDGIFNKIRKKEEITLEEESKYKSMVLVNLAILDAKAGWVMQLHLGALRNNNLGMMRELGSDTGYDSIGDFEIAKPLAKFLDTLNSSGLLPKTLLYNLNPRDNALMATMLGNFPPKIQYGPAWWFLDQKDGMEEHIKALSSLGLLSKFIGMTTDSRSFLSYPRHEYFRRVLCNMLGDDVEKGLLPDDMKLLGKMVENICFNNAQAFFGMEV